MAGWGTIFGRRRAKPSPHIKRRYVAIGCRSLAPSAVQRQIIASGPWGTEPDDIVMIRKAEDIVGLDTASMIIVTPDPSGTYAIPRNPQGWGVTTVRRLWTAWQAVAL